MSAKKARPVLLAWELGANLGHAMPLGEIARLLQDRDVDMVCFARDLRSAAIAFRNLPVKLFQSPVWPPYRFDGQLSGPGNYANVLTSVGFGRPDLLGAVVLAWINVLKLLKPSVVVCDSAPALQIACKITNIPTIAVGTPYLMPPVDGQNLPAFDALFSPAADERTLLTSARAVFSQHGKPVPESLPAVLATQFRFVFGLPEIDPYFSVRNEPLYLPLGMVVSPSQVPQQPRLFAYMGADDPVADKLFTMLVETGVPVDAYLRDNEGVLARFLRRRGMQVFENPPALEEVLPISTHVITAGGAHLTQAAMLAGRAQIIFPGHEESWSNAQMARRLNVARVMERHAEAASMRDKLVAAINDHALMRSANALGADLAGRQHRSGAAQLTAAIARYCA